MSEYKCDKCGSVFSHEKSLSQHMNDKHLKPQPQEPAPDAHQPIKPIVSASNEGGKKTVKFNVTKSMLMVIIGIVVAIGAGYGAYTLMSSMPAPPVEDTGEEDTISQVSAPIGQLGSAHEHADFAIFLDGEEITPLEPRYFVRTSTVHVEGGPGAGSVIHTHATSVPIGFFFRSIGMTFNQNCFILDNGAEYCNDGDKTLKMYVKHQDGEWEENKKYHTYVIEDFDQILITYGDETEEEIQQQLNSVGTDSETNFGRTMDLGGGLIA